MQGLFTWPEMQKTLVPVFFGRPIADHQAAPLRRMVGATAMVGVVIMLGVAGLLEGFARQLTSTEFARFSIGGAMLVFWLSYFYLLRLVRAR